MSIRHCLEFAITLLLVVLFFRIFLAEAYVVPTGSMAPALAGRHKVANCEACGFPVMVGRKGLEEKPEISERCYQSACCPNCGGTNLQLEQAAECEGDRLLVHKHVFDLRSPKRWEMIVFRNPNPGPQQKPDSYIKRLVGLPGESVQIHDGDVYVNGRIARKNLAELRGMRLLVHDNDFTPSDAPAAFRWNQQPSGKTGSTRWMSYRHLVRRDGQWREEPLKDSSGYNGGHAENRLVHDVMLECDLSAAGNGKLELAITDGRDDVLIEIPVGTSAGQATVKHAPAERLGSFAWKRPEGYLRLKSPCSLPADRPVHLELALVDRRLLFAMDGKEVLGSIDLDDQPPLPPLRKGGSKVERRPMNGPLALGGVGPVSIGGDGIGFQVSHLRLYRDIHYTGDEGTAVFPHGTHQPVQLGAGEYFVLGDNSASSYDSRRWERSPVVRHADLIGKPFLIHLPTRVLSPEQPAWAVPDWSRMKLLR